MESENYIDDVHAFFQNAHHLKDWLKNDPGVPKSVASAIEGEIDRTNVLRVCADICNSTKHLSLRNSRSAENVSFGRKTYGLHLGVGQDPIISVRYEVVTDSGNLEAFNLASQVLDAWTGFLERHKLLRRRLP